ncbi:MAG: sulfite exporter TauE/SafE family protein [Dehalococcoidia bacterium]|nr:MAG: sulfite exporter TauE/SafE family protein [Dehalococcoidia bacterium]
MGNVEFLSGFPLVLFLVGLGFLAGSYGTLVGIGGAVVLTPVLLLLYPQAKPEVLTSITMGIVFLNSLSGTIAYARQRRIDYRNGILFALATVPGTILGVWTLQFMAQRLFEVIFGAMLLVFSGIIWMRPHIELIQGAGEKQGHQRVVLTDRKGETFTYTCNRSLGIILSFGVGFIAGLLGIGGGIIHVPMLIYVLCFPTHIATATSHFILVFTGLAGTLTHAASGTYAQSWQILLWIALGVIPGAQLGAWLSPRIKGLILIRLLVLALVLAGVRLVFMGIRG